METKNDRLISNPFYKKRWKKESWEFTMFTKFFTKYWISISTKKYFDYQIFAIVFHAKRVRAQKRNTLHFKI